MQCKEGGKWGCMWKVDMSCKVVRSEGMGLKCDCKLCGKIYCKLHTILSYWCVTLCTRCIVSCIVSMAVNCPGCICSCLVGIVAILWVLVVLCVYCFVFDVLCVICSMCVLLVLLYMLNCWLEVSIRKVLRPANLTQVFLGFPVSISKCSYGSQDSKLPLCASHIALPTYKY